MFCPKCGEELQGEFCSKCGTAAQVSNNNIPTSRNWLVLLLLCVFLGCLGIHRFYAGKIGTGVLWLLTGGVFGIGWLVDLIVIASGNFQDGNGAYIKNEI